jgi:hypothetical protein
MVTSTSTRKGRAVAEHMALRHQLAEMLLTDVIGIPWSKAHDEAERLEHAISPEIEALLLKRFADKKSCPHGLPLRGGVTQLRKQGAVLLSDLQANERAEIVCVYEKDGKFLEFLDNLHLPRHPTSSPAANTMKLSPSAPPTALFTSASPRLPASGSAASRSTDFSLCGVQRIAARLPPPPSAGPVPRGEAGVSLFSATSAARR